MQTFPLSSDFSFVLECFERYNPELDFSKHPETEYLRYFKVDLNHFYKNDLTRKMFFAFLQGYNIAKNVS